MKRTVIGKTYAVAIGDVVGSRSHENQQTLISTLTAVLDRVNEEVEAVQPLRMTVGEEFQGAWADIGSALDATLLTRLRLAGECERAPMAQSGSAWWLAREAIERVVEVEPKRHVTGSDGPP